ncbi:MAG: polyphosphate polymerase domain-containing protein [Clostridiales bacterium]|nr:polyphosphate polymerase domain-containing protein [Clostridiales bacterium]
MNFRHEWKIEINQSDHLALRSRVKAIMDADPHAIDGRYTIRSLYFDNPTDRAFREKIDGVNKREKFRIRYYNQDTSFLCLEKKSKRNGLCHKQSAQITAEQAQAIINGDDRWMKDSPLPLVQELYRKMKTEGLKPKTVVDYVREPFVYPPGNVRVTFDYNIRTGLQNTDFLKNGFLTIPAGDAPILMEVKWDAFLPDIIRDAIQLPGRRAAAFSKYVQCRIYG